MLFPQRPAAAEAQGDLQTCALGVGPGLVMPWRIQIGRDVEAKSDQAALSGWGRNAGLTSRDFRSLKPVVPNLFSQETLRREITLPLRGKNAGSTVNALGSNPASRMYYLGGLRQ